MKPLSKTLVVASILCLGGCSKSAPTTALPDRPTSAGSREAAIEGGDERLQGVVAERLEVPNYTYLHIRGRQGEAWVAVPTSAVKVGAEVTIDKPMPMQNFHSPTLNRTFPTIFFGGSAQVTNQAAQPHLGNRGILPAPNADLGHVTVARAQGDTAHTVAEVYLQGNALKNKIVSVRGRVVKVTDSVLNRNWLHLRDGSGSDEAKNNDLVVTTTAEVKVNDEITVEGVVHTDKNLGSGYVYSVLIEDAKVSR